MQEVLVTVRERRFTRAVMVPKDISLRDALGRAFAEEGLTPDSVHGTLEILDDTLPIPNLDAPVEKERQLTIVPNARNG